MRLRDRRQMEGGITLLEMAVALSILGIMLLVGLLVLTRTLTSRNEDATFERMTVIADAVSVYAQQNMRIPCPADPAGGGPEPFGAERGSGANGTAYGSCTNPPADREGILPYVTLGLPAEMARDQWGRYFTYRISPTSTLSPAAFVPGGAPPYTNAATRIENWCMVPPLWYADTDFDGTPDSLPNLPKAGFCCGSWGAVNANQDIVLRDSTNAAIMGRTPNAGGSGGEYRTTPPANALTTLAGTFKPLFPAYVLVSHGQNGNGSYRENGGSPSGGELAVLSVAERENADGDNIFYVPERSAPVQGGVDLDRTAIDDIVFWETPSSIMSRLGGMSCAGP